MKSFLTILFLFLNNVCNSLIFDINMLPKINHEAAVTLVKASTAILPQFDSVGHHVLNANQGIINKLLETEMDPEIKKKIILKVIEYTRQGDEMGGKILQDYYNFIDYLL